VRNTRELCIVRDEFVEREYNSSYVVSTFQQAFLSARGPIEIEEKDLVCVWIDKQITGCNVLMHDAQFQIN
jgi:hypothetical protein